jgi:hypothetical protein
VLQVVHFFTFSTSLGSGLTFPSDAGGASFTFSTSLGSAPTFSGVAGDTTFSGNIDSKGFNSNDA